MEKVISNKEMEVFGYPIGPYCEVTKQGDDYLKIQQSENGKEYNGLVNPKNYNTTQEGFMAEIERLNSIN